MPEAARKETEKNIDRLKKMHPESAESSVIRTYLDWMFELPWGIASKDNMNLKRAKSILNQDHYGLEKVKERILEYLSVRKLTAKAHGPDPVLRRPARRRQNLAGQVHRPRPEQEVRAHLPGRRARRGRDPRPPPHLRRRPARQDHPGTEERRLATTRCS